MRVEGAEVGGDCVGLVVSGLLGIEGWIWWRLGGEGETYRLRWVLRLLLGGLDLLAGWCFLCCEIFVLGSACVSSRTGGKWHQVWLTQIT